MILLFSFNSVVLPAQYYTLLGSSAAQAISSRLLHLVSALTMHHFVTNNFGPSTSVVSYAELPSIHTAGWLPHLIPLRVKATFKSPGVEYQALLLFT